MLQIVILSQRPICIMPKINQEEHQKICTLHSVTFRKKRIASETKNKRFMFQQGERF